MSETDPFNCPKCGAHDYGLYAAGLLPCPHCQAAELAAAKAEIERLRGELSKLTARIEYRQMQDDWRQCVCGNYRKGELTGGWQCPVHGQQW